MSEQEDLHLEEHEDEDEDDLDEALDAFFDEAHEWAERFDDRPGVIVGQDSEDDGEDEDEEDEPAPERDDDDEDDGPSETGRASGTGRFAGPPGFLTVGPEDCLRSLAARYRVEPDTIWNHGNNADLKAARADRRTLLAGDRLFIPERRQRVVKAATHRRHTFKLATARCEFEAVFRRGGEPRAGIDYTLEVAGQVIEGKTDGDGLVKAQIPATARRGELTLHAEGGDERYVLGFGALDPIDTPSGVQARLNNLGYGAGRVDGEPGEVTATAIRRFQRDQELDITGEIDDALRAALLEVHAS